jgi:hypothetical protein
MDESKRKEIEERIAIARRMTSFQVPQDLANDAEWLMSELTSCEVKLQYRDRTIARQGDLLRSRNDELLKLRMDLESKTREWMAAVTNGDNLKEQARRLMSDLGAANEKRDRLERELDESRAKPKTLKHDEALVELLTYIANDCSSGREAAIAILSELASIPVELPRVDELAAFLRTRKPGAGIAAEAALEFIGARLAPLLAARKATELPNVDQFVDMMIRKFHESPIATYNGQVEFAAREVHKMISERAVKSMELPNYDELTEWFNSGYGDAESEHIADHESSVSNGIRVLRDKLAERIGKKMRAVNEKKDAHPVVKTESTSSPERGLRQRFIEATKALGKDLYGRSATTDDLLTLIALIDSPKPCSSAEAVARACKTFSGAVFNVDPSTRTLCPKDWGAIARELKKHLGYEPTVYSDRIELRDGIVWYDSKSDRVTFTMH